MKCLWLQDLKRSNSQSAPQHIDNDLSHHDENENIAPGNVVPLVGLDGVPAVDLINVSSYVAVNRNLVVDPESSVRGGTRSAAHNAHGGEVAGISLRVIFVILQAQQAAIAQLQNQNHQPSRVELEPSQEVVHKVESTPIKSNEKESETNPAVIKMLEELKKWIETGEKKIEENDKKVETYNSKVDQILGHHWYW